MKNIFKILFVMLMSCTYAHATGETCFMMVENEKVLKQEGDIKKRYAPCSTFKIFLSLIGFDAGILEDEEHPNIPFKDGDLAWLDSWKQAHTPKLWIKNSCLWYSHFIAQKMGITKFKEYIDKFSYGNQDLSGDLGKNNALTNAWLSSSLEISPEEQMVFLRKFVNNQLPVSPKAHEMTRQIMYIQDLEQGWKLFGKTGSGVFLTPDRASKLQDKKFGWFIGWIEKGDRKILFVQYVALTDDENLKNEFGSPKARELVKEELTAFIQTPSSSKT